MEYRNTRALSRSHALKKSTRKSTLSVITLFLVCGIIVLIFCTSQAAEWLMENVISPIFSLSDDTVPEENIASTWTSKDEQNTVSPSDTVEPELESITETIEKMSFYFLQMGSFTTESEAESAASAIRAMGAAGEIYMDGDVHRLFAACYDNMDDLTTVQDQIRSDGFENTAYILHSDEIKIDIQGKKSDVLLVKKTAGWLGSLPKLMTEYVIVFDRDGLTVKQGFDKIRQWRSTTTALLDDLNELKQNESVRPLYLTLQDYAAILSTFPEQNDTIDIVNASSILKSMQIQTIVRYCKIVGED